MNEHDRLRLRRMRSADQDAEIKSVTSKLHCELAALRDQLATIKAENEELRNQLASDNAAYRKILDELTDAKEGK